MGNVGIIYDYISKGGEKVNNNEIIELFLSDIAESDQFQKIKYIFFTIPKSSLEYIARFRNGKTDLFMIPLQEYIKSKFEESDIDVDNLFKYMIDYDSNGWVWGFAVTLFKRKDTVSELYYVRAITNEKKISPYIEWDSNLYSGLILGFVMDFFSDRTINIKNMIRDECFYYQTNQYGLSKINGAVFNRDGLIFDNKSYLYNILTNTSVIEFTDKLPGFARIINDQITNGDILYRIDERLAIPEEQAITFSTTNFEKFYGPQFHFKETLLKENKNIIVHIDTKTMSKLLMVIKQCKGEITGDIFWHIEIETLPYIQEDKYKANYVITTFLHGMYFPDENIFTHIDFTKNQYNLDDYLLKYSQSKNNVPIDFYAEKELHYKIWCVENGTYSIKTWYDFMIASLEPKYQVLLNEMLE